VCTSGTIDDVGKASDYRISPFEWEGLLIEHTAVAEAAVAPAPDPVRTAVPKAYAVLTRGWTADRETALAIVCHNRARAAPYKWGRRIESSEVPKTISGKIRRVKLRRAKNGARAAEFREEDLLELGAGCDLRPG
jgi:acetyl-CoA synthetase